MLNLIISLWSLTKDFVSKHENNLYFFWGLKIEQEHFLIRKIISFRIGLCGFDNPLRDAKTTEVKRQIGQVRNSKKAQ